MTILNKQLPVNKADFPSLENQLMLSSCSQSAPPQAVFDGLKAYQDTLITRGMDWTAWMKKVENAKRKFAELINAEPEEIAILSTVSDAISSVINTLPFETGDEVVVTELDFPCVGQVLQSLNLRKNVPITFIPETDHSIDLKSFEKYITPNTKLTCVPHVSYYNGALQDLTSISKITKENGSLLFVDAYQSAGAVPIDVREMGVDILVTGIQKYLMGIPGITFLYMKQELSSQLTPAVTGWFGQRNPFAFDVKGVDYADQTRRFNTGTPSIVNAYAAEQALNYILEVGISEIETYLKSLSLHAVSYAEAKGFQVVSPKDVDKKAPTTAIYVENANEVEEKMRARGIIVSARKDVIRIAPHIYNNEEDITHAIDILAEVVND
uniref:aminotransferase class V-fold PLP-dependent enzyme n=1 Tax=uncultured Allobacillus sp. TaxID=1638025 RepID=UPI00259769FA|nr:aminotransferase class V-fold PLP-dependent enzyme [uncultured Allobacillus sp.]